MEGGMGLEQAGGWAEEERPSTEAAAANVRIPESRWEMVRVEFALRVTQRPSLPCPRGHCSQPSLSCALSNSPAAATPSSAACSWCYDP